MKRVIIVAVCLASTLSAIVFLGSSLALSGGDNPVVDAGGPGPGKSWTAPKAIEAALDWFVRHRQERQGYWDSDGFSRHCKAVACGGKGYPIYDRGLTGLVTLAFLRSGHTPDRGTHKKVVSDALSYLRSNQSEDGCYSPQMGHYMYQHAICTLAVAEAYRTSRSKLLGASLDRALSFLYTAQNKDALGGRKLAWRYAPGAGDNDTSVTSWVVYALHAAERSGVKVPSDVFAGASYWIQTMTDPETGRIAYDKELSTCFRAPGRHSTWPPSKSEAVTAAGLTCRLLLGDRKKRDPVVARGIDLCLAKLPQWNEKDGSIDMYYWYHGTQLFARLGGAAWRKWRRAMQIVALENQVKEGCARGSWAPCGPWGEDGGRVYSTAMMALCLIETKKR